MDYIAYIINKYEEDLQHVKQNEWFLEIVKEQTPELCLAAVKTYANALQFVREQTNELCLIALEKDPWCFQHVITMNKEMWRLAVKKDCRILYEITDIELKLQLTQEITNEFNGIL